MPTLATKEDNWTPSYLKHHREWRKKMFAPKPLPEPEAVVAPKQQIDPLAARIAAVAPPTIEQLQARVVDLESKMDGLYRKVNLLPREREPLGAPEFRTPPKIEDIIRIVGKFYYVPPMEIKSARRCHSLLRARHVAMHLCRLLTTRSLPEIGRHFGGRDHTTILSGANKISRLRLIDPDLCHELAELEALFA